MIAAHMLNRDAEEVGDLHKAQFIRRLHTAFPRTPLLGRNAKGFGTLFPAARCCQM